jgi:Flp pilus assembly protein TadD
MILKRIILLLIVITMSAACGAKAQHSQIKKAGDQLRFELAQMYVEKGAREQAIPLLRRIIAAKPRHLGARVLYGSVLRDLGLYAQAKAEFQRVLRANPKVAVAHAGLGILYDLQRNFDKAKVHHRKAVALAPRRADFFNNLGFSYYLTQQHKKAIWCYQRALALDPGLALAYNNLGFAYGASGELELAERTFRTALGDAGALYNMALVYESTGDESLAATFRERAFESDPELRAVYVKSKESRP